MIRTREDARNAGATYVTGEWLRTRGACAEQIADFKALWPTGAPLTRSNLLRASHQGLSLEWLAEALPLTLAARHAYYGIMAPAKRAFEKASAVALADALGLEGVGS